MTVGGFVVTAVPLAASKVCCAAAAARASRLAGPCSAPRAASTSTANRADEGATGLHAESPRQASSGNVTGLVGWSGRWKYKNGRWGVQVGERREGGRVGSGKVDSCLRGGGWCGGAGFPRGLEVCGGCAVHSSERCIRYRIGSQQQQQSVAVRLSGVSVPSAGWVWRLLVTSCPWYSVGVCPSRDRLA